MEGQRLQTSPGTDHWDEHVLMIQQALAWGLSSGLAWLGLLADSGVGLIPEMASAAFLIPGTESGDHWVPALAVECASTALPGGVWSFAKLEPVLVRVQQLPSDGLCQQRHCT